MEMETGMPQEPPMDSGRLVGGEVVQHDVDLTLGFDTAVDRPQERHEILGPMLRLGSAR